MKDEEIKHNSNIKVTLFGLNNSGKTSLIKYLKGEKDLENLAPTKQFDVYEIVIKTITFVAWDSPGQTNLRDEWNNGAVNASVILFIIDVAAEVRFKEMHTEFNRVLNELDTKDAIFIVCFHKMDLPKTQQKIKKVKELLKLSEIKNRDIYWLNTSTQSGEGIDDLKDMLFRQLIIVDAKKVLKSIQDKYK